MKIKKYFSFWKYRLNIKFKLNIDLYDSDKRADRELKCLELLIKELES